MAKTKTAAAAPDDGEPQLPAVAPPAPPRALTLDLSVQDLLRQKLAIQEMLKEVLIPGVHYGPSYQGDDKKTLHQPGADALIVAFGLVPRFTSTREDIAIANEGMHREYTLTCTLYTRSGVELGSGLGSCSTMESKYRWRFAKPTCPVCGKEAIIKGKAEYGGGWICFAKKDGCGLKWPAGAAEIEGQQRGKVPNADIADTYNTILKLAAKRAKVAATILVTGCADMFTQDTEEQEEGDDDGRSRQVPPKASGQHAPAAGAPASPAAAPPAGRQSAPAPAPPVDLKGAPPPPDTTSDDEISKEYETLKVRADTNTAKKFWNHWKKTTEKAQRLDAMRRANVALKAIMDRLGNAAERLLRDVLLDRANPDDVLGILADLERSAGAPPPAASPAPPPSENDEPPY